METSKQRAASLLISGKGLPGPLRQSVVGGEGDCQEKTMKMVLGAWSSP